MTTKELVIICTIYLSLLICLCALWLRKTIKSTQPKKPDPLKTFIERNSK